MASRVFGPICPSAMGDADGAPTQVAGEMTIMPRERGRQPRG